MKPNLIGLSQNPLDIRLERTGPKTQGLILARRLSCLFLSLASKEKNQEYRVLPIGGYFRCFC